MREKKPFTFEISLSVLNHLGRNLYRSFVTVLGEAISNSWDADAENVWIYIDRENNRFVIKDDGIGMTRDDFQNKFLKIGYSKRKDGRTKSDKGRPFIGRKGIGKLALLSCAERVSVISKTEDGVYTGGVIDNSGLDKAITDDMTPQEYPLGEYDNSLFDRYTVNHGKGTVIHFEGIKGGIKNRLEFLKKVIALYFRFSLVDESFNIYVDDELITHEQLKDLASKTEFLWKVNDISDPYISYRSLNIKEQRDFKVESKINGFIASVGKPRDIKIFTADERVSIDLFVNGRLREKDILKHIPTARLAENYLYGQIHFDELDDIKEDRFTSSRESVVANDPKYQEFLKKFRKDIINKIIDDWDKWRIKNKKDGDSENPRIPRKERKSRELYNAVSEEYIPTTGTKNKKQTDDWVAELEDDAQYNFISYAECFISENLIRKYIKHEDIVLSKEAEREMNQWRDKETQNKGKGNISIDIRRNNSDLSYLSMDSLANLVDRKDPNIEACLRRDANEYKPIRDALAHTAILTDVAKSKLTSVYENIKGRIKTLLSTDN